jgi:subtilisin family serine protease
VLRVFFLFLSIAFLLSADASFASSKKPHKSWQYAKGEILVKYKKHVSKASQALHNRQFGIQKIKEFKSIGVHHLKIPPDMSVEDAVEMFKNNPDVEYAEPNYVLTIAVTPNDPSFDKLWGLHNTGQTGGTADADIDAPEAWDITTGLGNVVIAVIDTGVDYDHPDLSNNIWVNTGETDCTDGLDDDGNGYTDDCIGWDFANNDNDPIDDNGHGTHVAGTIAAEGNNSTGITGVMWTAKIMPLKFMDADGVGYTSDAISAIEYARANGAHIVNCSWGNYDEDPFLKDAIDNASSILFSCAAGNDTNDNDSIPFYPASYQSTNILSVTATDQNDNLASFSNYGKASVHIAAPGVDIYSTIYNGSYAYSSGTSMAAPFVSGVAGLVLSNNPALNSFQARELILSTVDNKGLSVITEGRLNAYNAVTADINSISPAPPSHLEASITPGSEIQLTWVDNSSVETNYVIEKKTGINETYSELVTLIQNTTSYTDTDVTLAEGTAYFYRVRAYNTNGYSLYSNEANVIIPPNAPSNLSASALSTSGIKLTWTDNSAAENGFRIERKTSDGTYTEIATTGANETSYSDTGLSAGITYFYRVRAYNDEGNSSYSNEAQATTLVASGGGGGCFIATAAYGSYLAPEVITLKKFRDKYLITNPIGRKIVKYYYRHSPPLAEYISKHPPLRLAVRIALTPLVYGIKYPIAAVLAAFAITALIYIKNSRKGTKR